MVSTTLKRRLSIHRDREQSGQRSRTVDFLLAFSPQAHGITEGQWFASYTCWARGGSGWNYYGMGGTCIQRAIARFQHVHKPGSREWRPTKIMDAVDTAANVAPAQPREEK